ncbi:MAG: hypothetical protein ACLQMT_11300 [Candidatus Acidiferrales bacterium]
MFQHAFHLRRVSSRALAALALGFAALVLAGSPAANSQPPAQAVSPGNPQAPSDAEMTARAQRLIANQHKDDDALDEYERIERVVDRTGGPNPRTLQDRTYRVVPDGGGPFKILLKENGRTIDPAEYRKELQTWRDTLDVMLKSGDSRAQTAKEKYAKKKHDRADLVDAMQQAFTAKWLRQETRDGRVCDVIELDPDPNFHPHSIFQEALQHAMVTIWVDHGADQLVYGEAHITRDISVGGGILGKLYRGSVFSMEQAEVTPGIWEPTRYQYDFMGRKFLFPFEEHQFVETSRYRVIGSPRQALAVVEDELASGKSTVEDP